MGLRTFAGLVGERASTVSAIESGRRAPWRREETLRRVANVLGKEDQATLFPDQEVLAGHGATGNGELEQPLFGGQLLWWWAGEEATPLEPVAVAALAEFVGAETSLASAADLPQEQIAWPSLTELAIEWRVRNLLGRRGAQVTVAPVDVEAVLEHEADVWLEIVPGLVPQFSVQACAVATANGTKLYIDRIVSDSRPLASYRYLLASCYAPVTLYDRSTSQTGCAEWFHALQHNECWPQALRDCQRFALAMLLPASPVLAAAQSAYQEVVSQQGWVDVEIAARSVRNRLAEQFAVPPPLVHRRLMRWPCHVYGRIAQALAAEEIILPPADWIESKGELPMQRELFKQEVEAS